MRKARAHSCNTFVPTRSPLHKERQRARKDYVALREGELVKESWGRISDSDHVPRGGWDDMIVLRELYSPSYSGLSLSRLLVDSLCDRKIGSLHYEQNFRRNVCKDYCELLRNFRLFKNFGCIIFLKRFLKRFFLKKFLKRFAKRFLKERYPEALFGSCVAFERFMIQKRY